ncbi:thr operon leader peptide [Pantoea sp. 1.19]|uniref:thr operon leader peptide n=1 Tax=Pantoea sp. 1.19 TaxID=1925589 RepID=UPI000948CD38
MFYCTLSRHQHSGEVCGAAGRALCCRAVGRRGIKKLTWFSLCFTSGQDRFNDRQTINPTMRTDSLNMTTIITTTITSGNGAG